MRIQELERKTGLDRSTIRFYEREGFLRPDRTENGYRDYSESDCGSLLKIKLLRQLGMELSTIRALQTGEQDFSAAMDAQIKALQAQILSAQQSKSVCQMIRDEVDSYASLDARHYLDQLGRMQREGRDSVMPRKVPEFSLPVQVHPVRRYVARELDHAIMALLVQLVVYVLLRVRPVAEGFGNSLLGIGVYLLMIPVEAALLHFFGATPGKWLMGIHLEACDGGKLRFSDMLWRSWQVFYLGMGCGIPFVRLWLLIRNYCLYTGKRFPRFVSAPDEKPQELGWDSREWEIVYEPWEGKRKGIFAAALVLLSAVNTFIAMDIMKPTYRSNDLTVAKFAENYNDLLVLMDSECVRMLPDGSWENYYQEGNYIIFADGEVADENKPLSFVLEQDAIREISHENTYQSIFSVNPVPNTCFRAAVAALYSQPGTWYWELEEFADLLESHQTEASGLLRYQNIEVQWSSEAIGNTVLTSFGYTNPNDEEHAAAQISWTIIIHEIN